MADAPKHQTHNPPARGFISPEKLHQVTGEPTGNSTTVPLQAGGVFTGATEEVTAYTSLTIFCFTDVHSQTEGLKVQFSTDGENWDKTISYSVQADVDFFVSIKTRSKFFRVIYTNETQAQTFFRLQTILYVNRIDDFDEYDLTAIADGKVPGKTLVHKYGRNPDVGTGSFESVWNGGGEYAGHNATAAEILTVNSNSDEDAGTLLSTGTSTSGNSGGLTDTGASFITDTVAIGDVLINDTHKAHGIITALTETTVSVERMSGKIKTNNAGDVYRIVTKAATGCPVVKLLFLLDGNLDNETSEYVITNGQSLVDTTGTYRRQSRGRAVGGDSVGDITCAQKVTTANIFMVMPAGYNTTMVCAYTLPRGKHGLFVNWFSSILGSTTASADMRLQTREVNDVFVVQEEVTLRSSGTSYIAREFSVPKDSLDEMTDIKVNVQASLNNTVISAGFDLLLIDDD